MSSVYKILIVDDEPRMCDSLKVLLGNEGYEIQTRHNGQEALETLVKNDFDVVLLDLVLPDISGAEIMDHINSQAPETFVIVITGHASSDSAIDSLKKGAFDYLRKPFEHEELSKTVKNALDHKALKSERKRVGEALRESEEKYKTLVDASITGIFIHQDGKYVFVNDRFAEMHYYTPKELLGKEYLTLIHPEERDAFAQIASARLKGEAVPQRYEVRRLRKDGTTIWCEMMAKRIEHAGRPAVMGNIIDISERKRMEEALREQARLNELLLDSLPHPAMLIHRDRTVLAANRIAREVGAKVDGYCWRDFGQSEYIPSDDKRYINEHAGNIPPGGTKCTFCLGDNALTANKPMIQPEVKAFGQLWEAWWIPIEGDVYFHSAINITERKRAEEALRESEKQRYRDEKRLEILKFANDVSLKLMHELRNPLVAIGGFSKRLSSSDYPEDKLKEYATVILEGSMKLDKVLNEVLAHLKAAAEQV